MRKWAIALSLLSSLLLAEEPINKGLSKETPSAKVTRVALPAPTAPFPNARIVVDPYYSPYMGAELLYTGFDSLSRFEDNLLPATRNGKRQLWPCMLRLVDQMAWDAFGRYMEIWQHEFFGHGFRVRSLGVLKARIISYENEWDSGATNFGVTALLSTSEMLSIDLAGLEAEDILVRTFASKWIQNGNIDSRLAGLYLDSALSSWGYAMVSLNDPVTDKKKLLSEGNDIKSYVYWINELYPQTSPMTAQDIVGQLSCNFLDPLIYFNIYAKIKYILYGERGPVPMMSFNIDEIEFKFLPTFRARLTPYGIENGLGGYFLINGNPLTVDVRWGELANFTFGGVHLDAPFLIELDAMSMLGFEVDVWKQPDFEASPTLESYIYEDISLPRPSHDRYGCAVFANLTTALNEKEKVYGYLKVGYKTKGYLPGYTLDASWLVRGGLALKF